MPFNINGFLSPDLKGWTDSARSDHKVWFDLAEELNRACMEVLLSAKPLQTSEKQLVASLIFGRSLQSFQGVILLAERGMMADARTLVRSCAESAIALGCASVDDDFLDDLIASNVKHRKTVADKILSSSEILNHLEQEQTDKLKQLRDDLKDIRSDSMRWEQAAQKAGFSVLYDTVYRATSGDAAHVTIDALNRHLKTDFDQNITGLSFQPKAKDLNDTLSCAISALLHSLYALGKSLGRNDYEQFVKIYNAKWKALVLSDC
jgi:hypothetical protein